MRLFESFSNTVFSTLSNLRDVSTLFSLSFQTHCVEITDFCPKIQLCEFDLEPNFFRKIKEFLANFPSKIFANNIIFGQKLDFVNIEQKCKNEFSMKYFRNKIG